MGVREFVEKQKRWAAPAICVGIALCGYSAFHSYRSQQLPGMVEQVYFSDDDGQTFFADDVSNGYSFDHGGKTALRAFVYECNSGKPFVGLLVRAAGDKQHAPAPAAPAGSAAARYKGQKGPPPMLEVRKPKETKWVIANSPEAQKMISSLCPEEGANTVLP